MGVLPVARISLLLYACVSLTEHFPCKSEAARTVPACLGAHPRKRRDVPMLCGPQRPPDGKLKRWKTKPGRWEVGRSIGTASQQPASREHGGGEAASPGPVVCCTERGTRAHLRPQASATSPAPCLSCCTLSPGPRSRGPSLRLSCCGFQLWEKEGVVMLFLGRQRPGQPASQGQPPFNPFLEATELRRQQATAALCVQVRASPHPVAVLGSVGTDGTEGPCPVCRVQHRPFPSSSPVLLQSCV